MKELGKRLLFLIIAILVYRLGVHIPVAGVSSEQLSLIFSSTGDTFIGLFDVFSGGALSQMSIFSLGVVPYISSSIAMQLAQYFVPHLNALKKEGNAGRLKITQYTRYLTVILAFFQSAALCFALQAQEVFIYNSPLLFWSAVLSIVSGSVFLMWIGEQINERGIGNGISMLIFVSIVSTLPSIIIGSVEQARQGSITIFSIILMFVMLALLSFIVVIIERAQRKIALGSSVARRQASADSAHFLPLKINIAGVIPAIFASSILLLPYSLIQWFSTGSGFFSQILYLLSPNQPLYLVLFVACVFFFCFFYTSIIFNSFEVANNLKRSNSFIPGIRPGRATEAFLSLVIKRLTLVGAFYISIVSLFPQLSSLFLGFPFLFAGTSVLIVIVVVIDFMSQLQSHLLSFQYSSMLEKSNFQNYSRK